MKISIIIATHKKYKLPEDKMYIPVQSGSSIYPDLGYQKDNDGDNISLKNKAYNIMCVMYWGWKNLKTDYIGIVHYRRHFTAKKKYKKSFNDILSRPELELLLKKADIILSPKRKYFFMTIKQHYIYTKGGYTKIHRKDINVLRSIISDFFNEYLEAFDIVMNKTSYHSGHLLIMKKSLYNEYCDFIFTIGDKVENQLKNERSDLTRYVASLTELLVDVWIIKNKYNYIETGLIEFEKPNLFKKSFSFIRRTLTGHYPGTIKYLDS